jgi:hypothetical protein
VLAGLRIQQQPPHWQMQTLSAIRVINTQIILLRKETFPIFTSQREDCQHWTLSDCANTHLSDEGLNQSWTSERIQYQHSALRGQYALAVNPQVEVLPALNTHRESYASTHPERGYCISTHPQRDCTNIKSSGSKLYYLSTFRRQAHLALNPQRGLNLQRAKCTNIWPSERRLYQQSVLRR